MTHRVETSVKSQSPIKFGRLWLAFGVVCAVFTVSLLILRQNQLSLRTELTELRHEVASVQLLAQSIVDKLDSQPSEFIPFSPSDRTRSIFLFPNDQMYFEDMREDGR